MVTGDISRYVSFRDSEGAAAAMQSPMPSDESQFGSHPPAPDVHSSGRPRSRAHQRGGATTGRISFQCDLIPGCNQSLPSAVLVVGTPKRE
jgi:hypothetical protein